MGDAERKCEDVVTELCLRFGDDRLILGQLLSAWCAHAPTLEEDIALSNIALDCIGQASLFLSRAGQLEGKNRSDDDLAFFRSVRDFRCCLLVQQPNGDFAQTILRHFLYDSFAVPVLTFLQTAPAVELKEVSQSSLKEVCYHVKHSREWVKRLGLGTEESNRRLQHAFLELWPYFDELFIEDEWVETAIEAKLLPPMVQLREEVRSEVLSELKRASIIIPENIEQRSGGRKGMHSEYLGRVISEMQSLPREFPGAQW